jgi:hypothetical protein
MSSINSADAHVRMRFASDRDRPAAVLSVPLVATSYQLPHVRAHASSREHGLTTELSRWSVPTV